MMTVEMETKEQALANRVGEAAHRAGVLALDTAPGSIALANLPYPTTRLERWKYTRTARLLELAPMSAGLGDITPPDILPGLDAITLTFVNGVFAGGDIVDQGADGCFIGPLSMALDRHPDRVAQRPQAHFTEQEWFAALNASAPQDGAFIWIGKGKRLDRPVLIRQHLGPGHHGVQPRHIIHVEPSASAEVILWSDADPGASGLFNATLDAHVGGEGRLDMEIVQDEQGEVHHIGHHHFDQENSSVLRVRTATACAHWLRNDLHIRQAGSHASSTFHGCYLPNGKQFVDHHTRIDHAHPDGRSDELYKGLAADGATAVFNGKIMVHPDAQRIEAYQSNANLLLGEQAAVFTKPELEIYADDVRCSHGCTTGQFDAEALFYLRSRGMTETAARNLLVQAFLAEVLDGFREEIRDHVHAVYARRLGWT